MANRGVQRRLAAILVADVVGYSARMEADEAGTLRAVKQQHQQVIDPAIAASNGRVVKLMGDGTLAEFGSALDAVNCAMEIQEKTAKQNAGRAPDRGIELRIGINLGDVIVEGEDIYGEGVNVAVRLEGLAEPGGICLSGSVHDAIGNKLSLRFEYLGEQTVKNLVKPVRTYRVHREVCERGPLSEHTAPRPTSAFQPSGGPSLAVKPFELLGSNLEYEEFADCLTNGIIVGLSRLPGLILVQDESSSLQYTKRTSAEELAQRFAVRFLLMGQVRKAGARVRVTAELLEVETGRYVWGDSLDRELRDFSDVFEIQDEITEEIVTALDIKLVSGEIARITRKVLTNPIANENLYNGERLLWQAANKLELQEAQRLLEDIIRIEPSASIGYAEAALAHWVAGVFGFSDDPEQSLNKAVELANKAIELDDVTGYPHMILAQVHLHRRDFDEAKAEANKAVSDRPSCPASFAIKAGVLNYLGDANEAISHAQHAARLSPVDPTFYPAVLASSFHTAGRYEDGIAAANDAIQIDAKKIEPHVILSACAMALGHIEQAQRSRRAVLALKPDFRLS